MSAYQEFEKIIFKFAVEAAVAGGKEAIGQGAAAGVEYGHTFHFEDVDSLKYLSENAIQLAESSASRLRGNLEEVIRAGLKDGKPIKEITQDVHGVFENFKGWEAERIARTEIARGVDTGAVTGYKEMGIGVAEVYANAGACPICAALNGELWTVDKAMQVLPRHPNCYCFWLPRPDIKRPEAIEGWRSMGEIAQEVLKGLGVTKAFSRTAISPKVMTKVADVDHFGDVELARLVVEGAEKGFIDKGGAICLVMDKLDDTLYGFVPVKMTDDLGMIVTSGYKIGQRQLNRRLREAKAVYGL